LYYVFPVNGSKIGICPQGDIWNSFDRIEDKSGEDLSIFNDIFDVIGIPQNYSEMKKIMKSIKLDKPEESEWTKNKIENDIKETFKKLNKYYINLWEAYVDMMDPNKNNFKLMNTKNYKNLSDREVWLDGESVLVNIGSKEGWIKRINYEISTIS
jgi:hypothetical protein